MERPRRRRRRGHAGGGGRRLRLLPRQRHLLAGLLLRGASTCAIGGRGRPARADRASAQAARRRGSARAAEAADPPAAAAHDRRDHRRGRQGARRSCSQRWAAEAGQAASCGASHPVQDRHAAPAIVRALGDLAAVAEVEVVIVARGGGSLADLLCFCDETLCRTVALLGVPVIASVGHHTDRTLLDDVAAVSCSTPTHAAEAAVGVDCEHRARPAGRDRAKRLRDHGRRAVLARARQLASLSRAPSAHLERQRTRLHQQLREIRAGARRRLESERSLSTRRATVLRARPRPRWTAASAVRASSSVSRSRSPATTRSGRSSGATCSPPPPDGEPILTAAAARPHGSSLRFADGTASVQGLGAMSEPVETPRAAAHLRGRRRARRGDHPPPGLRRGEPRRDARAGRRGQALIELCASQLTAVGNALEELRLDELVSRLEREAGA
jgi:hypothetical protein